MAQRVRQTDPTRVTAETVLGDAHLAMNSDPAFLNSACRGALLVSLASLAMAACAAPVDPGDASDSSVLTDGNAMDATYADVTIDTRPPVYDPYYDPAMRSPDTAITAPSERWTWVSFPDAVCANGQPTGIGVNLTTRSTRVMFFMMGGGACWDAATCYVVGSADHVRSGYTEAMFNSDSTTHGNLAMFDRANVNNPFRDYSWVFIPYCTGDVHSGNRIRFYNNDGGVIPTFFVGGRNMEVYLRRLVPTFAGADRVILSGSSAGGFGAAFNWDRVQQAFGTTRVDVLDDSGPPLDGTRYAMWVSTWNSSLPPGCADCATSPSAIVDYYATRYGTGHRFGLLSYDQDNTIAGFYGITTTQFQTQLRALTAAKLDPNPWIHYFYLTGTRHTMLGSGLSTVMGADGTTLSQFITQMLTDDPAWHSVHP